MPVAGAPSPLRRAASRVSFRSVMICHRVVVCPQASRPRAYIAPEADAELRDGWRWEPYAVDGTDVEAARQQLQRLMRDAEADIAEALSNDGWLTVLDGPLHGIRHRRGLPVIGYVKTHHRRMLAREHWVRVPELTAGERSGLFAMKDALYGCYLRVGNPGPWAGPWAGIARLEMPSGIGRDAAVEAAERAAGWLPVFASALHRDEDGLLDADAVTADLTPSWPGCAAAT